MAPKRGRHTRARPGPGGPGRPATSGRVTPPVGPGARGQVSFSGPSIEGLVAPLLTSLRAVAPETSEARPLGIELWGDRMAATIYGPDQMPPELFADLAAGLLASDDPDARPALAALAHTLSWREAKPLRRAHADHRARVGPDDDSDLGIGRATPTRAVEISDPCGDGVTLLVDLDQPGSPHTVGVYVDHNLAGLATDLLVGPPWAELDATGVHREVSGALALDVTLAEARARCEAALRSSDHATHAPVSPDFDSTRALVERRLDLLPTGGRVSPPERLEEGELDALVADFLAAPEGAGLSAAERDEAVWLLELWLDHATTETWGGPLRVSPLLIEQFCVDWYPQSVAVDAATAHSAPAVLAAWVRYATRATGRDDEGRDDALAAVTEWTPHLPGPADH